MAFAIREGRYIARLIYFEISDPVPRGNVVAFIYRDKDVESNEWFLYYRMRYYKDDKIGRDSADRRSAYLFKKEGRFEEICTSMIDIMKMVAMVGGNHKVDVIEIESDDPEVVMARLGEQSWAHGSVETPSGQVIQA